MSRLSLLVLLAVVAGPLVAQDEPPPRGTGATVAFANANDVQVTLSGYLQVDGRWLTGATQQLPDAFSCAARG